MTNFRTRVGCYAWLEADQRVLLARLGRAESEGGRWTLPGGGMEFGETPEETIRREVYEESGLRVEPRDILGSFSFGLERGRFRMQSVQIVYRAVLINGVLRPEVNGSTEWCEWIPVSEIDFPKSVELVKWAFEASRKCT